MNSSSFFCLQLLHDKRKNGLLYSFFICTLVLEIIFCRKSLSSKNIMTLEEYYDVSKLYELATSWIKDYTENDLGKYSAKLKKQHDEMQQLLTKTKQLIREQSGGVGEGLSADDLQKKITLLAEQAPAFASCFGDAKIPFDKEASVSKETTSLAFQLKKLTAAWYGKSSEDSPNHDTTSLISSIHDRAKELISAPKTLGESQIGIILYYSKGRDCSKMLRNVEIINDEYNGAIGVTCHLVNDGEISDPKLNIENFPAVFFKRGSKDIATHEGYISLSALQQKVGVLSSGSNFSDSTSVKSVKGLKSVNKKELYSLGEHLLFYFTIHNSGPCKKTTPIVERLSNYYHKVKFEQIDVTGGHNLHTSFGVNKVPALVFVHDGKVVGKHTGYINSSHLKRLLEQFAISNKKNIGNTTDEDVTIINKYLKDLEKGKKIKDKNPSSKEKKA